MKKPIRKPAKAESLAKLQGRISALEAAMADARARLDKLEVVAPAPAPAPAEPAQPPTE